MKKVLILACILSVFSLVACSKKTTNKKNGSGNVSGTNSEITTTEQENTQQQAENSEEESVKELEATIIEDKNFDFNASFDEALKLASGQIKKLENKNDSNAVAEEEDVILPPAPVTNIKGVLNWKKNLIDLTWDEPSNPEFSHVEIRNNHSNKVVIVPKGRTSYSFKPVGKDTQKYIITTCDSLGQKGPNVGYSFEKPYVFDSFSAPVVANTGNGKLVTATIKGVNFTKYGITEKDINLRSVDNVSITSRSLVHIINDNLLYATMTIPKSSGQYSITVTCGAQKLRGVFEVKELGRMNIGKVMYCDGVPESVIAGYDSLGFPFGIGLKEKSSLKWAAENSYGHDHCFNDIVSHPSIVGVNSATKATFDGDIDGIDNWNVICREDKNCKKSNGTIDEDYVERNYPIFNYALNYGELAKLPKSGRNGWYVPSISELCQIFKNREIINQSFAEIKGKKLKDDEFYWSSTQNDYSDYNACAVKFLNGAIYKYYNKGNAVSIRCIKLYK